MNYPETREFMCDIGRRVWQQGWAAANDGNFSVKIVEDLFMTTPTGVSKGFLKPDMMILVDGRGKKLEESKWNPSSELPLHLRCYSEREDIGAVCHAHPPIATAYAVANRALNKYYMPESIIAIGPVPLAPYACPSTGEVPESVAPLLQKHDVLLLANHGALAVGADLQTAYFRMETLEYYAKLCMNVELIGGGKELPRERLEELMELRKKLGFTGRHPGIL